MKVDLHCHSTASDGVLAPAEVVARAHGRGVELLALTESTLTKLRAMTDAEFDELELYPDFDE